MLSVNSYSVDYINACRSNIDVLLSSYKNLIACTKNNAAIESFEPNFFNHLVLVLDNYFCHRSRAMELKDGNPLNEVRMLCNSIMHNSSKLSVDKTIKYDPATSILKLRIGDEIKLSGSDFTSLFKAFSLKLKASM